MRAICIFVNPENSILFPNSGSNSYLKDALNGIFKEHKNSWRILSINREKELWIYYGEKIPENNEFDLLNNKKLEAIFIALHSSSMRFLQQEINKKFQNKFFRAKIYIALFSRESNNDIWCVFSNLIQKIQNSQSAILEFDKLTELIKKKPLTLRLSNLKHNIAHILLPIDIDIQGLIESGFQQNYWKEVSDTWKSGQALNALEDVKSMIYNSGKENSVENIVQEAKSLVEDNKCIKIKSAWEEVQLILKQTEELLNRIKQLLQQEDSNNIKNIQEMLKDNTFHLRFRDLDSALEILLQAIQDALQPEKKKD